MSENKLLDISWATILKIAITGLAFYFFYLIKDILIWIIFALIISVLFNPAIEFLKKFMPRSLAVVLIYTLIFGILGGSVYLVAPVFVAEIQQFSLSFSEYFEKISPPLQGLGIEAFENFDKFSETIEQELNKASANIFTAMGAIFGGVFSTITIFSIALFLSFEERGAERGMMLLTPKKYEAVVLNIWQKSQKKVSGWFGAKILASLFIALTTYLTCYVLKIDYAVSFAFFAGILNFIPYIGAIMAGLVITVIAAASFWMKGLFFLIAYVIIQQIEGNILTPVLTKRFIGLPPALVLIAVIVGGKLWGIMGAVLGIPIAGLLFEFGRDFLKKRKEEKAVVL